MDLEDWESTFPMEWQELHPGPFGTHPIPQTNVDIFRAGPLTTPGFDGGTDAGEMRITPVQER